MSRLWFACLSLFNDRCCDGRCFFFRAVCTDTRPEVTPAIRAGKGWRGRRELAPRRSATQIRCMLIRSYRQRHVRYTIVRTTTTTTTTTRRLGSQVLRASVIFVDTLAGDFSMAARAPPLVSSGGSAVRRRERRLRGFWRHEQLSIKMALASATHHSWQSRASVGVGAEVDVPVSVGVRSEVLTDPRPQERIQRRTVEHLAVLAPSVHSLDVPVPQMVENVTDTLLRILDCPMAEQVFEVPKISCSPCPSRSRFPEPQSAEQLVEVPTVLSPTRIALQIAEQIVGIPAPRGRGQGFLPGQGSPASCKTHFLS